MKIVHRITNVTLYKSEKTTMRKTLEKAASTGADLTGADLTGADLTVAYLTVAYLRKAKGYSESHDIFFEVIRRQKTETITTREWEMVGQLAIHRLCWDTIKKRFGKDIIPLFEKIASTGFSEYLERYTDILQGE